MESTTAQAQSTGSPYYPPTNVGIIPGTGRRSYAPACWAWTNRAVSVRRAGVMVSPMVRDAGDLGARQASVLARPAGLSAGSSLRTRARRSGRGEGGEAAQLDDRARVVEHRPAPIDNDVARRRAHRQVGPHRRDQPVHRLGRSADADAGPHGTRGNPEPRRQGVRAEPAVASNATTPIGSAESAKIRSTSTPSIASSPATSRVRSALSCAASAPAGNAPSASHAAANAIAPITLGEPASWRAGAVVQSVRSARTSRTAPPPARWGAPSSSQSRRPTRAPAPNGAYVSCPEKAM